MAKKMNSPNGTNSQKLVDIYTLHYNKLYCMAVKITSNREDAEDALQTTFLKISQNLDKIDKADSRKTFNYIVTILKNSITDLFRKKQRHPQVELIEEEAQFPLQDELPAVEDIVLRKLSFEEIVKCADKLKEPYKQAFNLYYFGDYYPEEIATALGITKEAVSMRIYRAKIQIRKMIAETKGGEKSGK